MLLRVDQIRDICENSRSPKVLSHRTQSRKCRMSIGFSVMPTETKIKHYLRPPMFSSMKACSLEHLTILRYFSEFPSWDLICRDYRLQKNVGNQMRSPLLFDSIVKSDRPSFEQRIHARSSTMTLSISWTQINVFPIEIPQETCFPRTQFPFVLGHLIAFQ